MQNPDYIFDTETLEYMDVNTIPGTPEPFTIDNDSKADWAVEKIKAEEAEFKRLEKIYFDRLKEMNEKMKELEDRRDRRTYNLKTLLLAYYYEAGPTKTTKTTATRELISGKLVMKKQQPEYVRDETDMIAWAETTAPDFVRIEKKISWGELKKQVTLSGEDVLYEGEVVPGVKAYARPDTFEVV